MEHYRYSNTGGIRFIRSCINFLSQYLFGPFSRLGIVQGTGGRGYAKMSDPEPTRELRCVPLHLYYLTACEKGTGHPWGEPPSTGAAFT